MATRGIRNNNPGNIDHHENTKWLGELPHDKSIESRFCRFDTPEHGLRAIGKTLLTYKRKYEIDTIAGVIMRWAPSTENNTASYIKSVSDECRVKSTDKIDLQEYLPILICAIVRHENGSMPYTASQIGKAVSMAIVK